METNGGRTFNLSVSELREDWEVMDCDNSMCHSTRKGVFSIQKEFTCAICHELFVRAHTLSCSHSYCERCIVSWLKKSRDCPTCRKPIEGKPIYSVALDNAVGKLVELRVENFAESLKKNDVELVGASVGEKSVMNPMTQQSECGTQTLSDVSRDLNKNFQFFLTHNNGPCNEFHFYNRPRYDDYSDEEDYDDYDDDYSDDNNSYHDYDAYNGLPGYYWGAYGSCYNCGK